MAEDHGRNQHHYRMMNYVLEKGKQFSEVKLTWQVVAS